MRLVKKFLAFSPDKQQRIVTTWALLLVARLSLWMLPFRTVKKLFVRPLPCRREDGRGEADFPRHPCVRDIVADIESLSRFVPSATCLTQAVVAHRMLTAAGHEVELQIGFARQPDGTMEAHAWVENGGATVLGGSGLDRFTRLRMASPR